MQTDISATKHTKDNSASYVFFSNFISEKKIMKIYIAKEWNKLRYMKSLSKLKRILQRI